MQSNESESFVLLENEDLDEQEARTFLRERFLRFIANITNKQQCEFKMYENSTVRGKLRAFDSNFLNIAVEDLQTPCLPPENAILRTRDIICMHLTDIPLELLNK